MMSIKPIPVILPPSFEGALGYNHNQRWVAFYWEPCGDEAIYDDGLWSTQCNWYPFLQFIHHQSVRPWLSEYNLGSSEDEAIHWLLCDLVERALFAGPRKEINAKLLQETHQDIPPSAPIIMTPEDITSTIDKFKAMLQTLPIPSNKEIMAAMERERIACDKMIQELDNISKGGK